MNYTRRPIHMNGGAYDLSQLGIPQQISLASLGHPALLSNLGVHNVMNGVANPLHPNMLRSTGGDLIDDLYHTGRHLLGVGLRGGDFLDTLFGVGRNLLGVGLYAQRPHGGDLLDTLFGVGRNLLGMGLDGHDLNNEIHKHGRRLQGGSFLDTLGRVGEAVLPHLADAGIHYLMSGGAIPAPPSRSPVTDPSQGGDLHGGDIWDFLNGTRNAFHTIGTPFKAVLGVNPADLGEDIAHAITGNQYSPPTGRGIKKPRKGRFAKGSKEAKDYMASIRKKKT